MNIVDSSGWLSYFAKGALAVISITVNFIDNTN
jgi:hypothetical protein